MASRGSNLIYLCFNLNTGDPGVPSCYWPLPRWAGLCPRPPCYPLLLRRSALFSSLILSPFLSSDIQSINCSCGCTFPVIEVTFEDNILWLHVYLFKITSCHLYRPLPWFNLFAADQFFWHGPCDICRAGHVYIFAKWLETSGCFRPPAEEQKQNSSYMLHHSSLAFCDNIEFSFPLLHCIKCFLRITSLFWMFH